MILDKHDETHDKYVRALRIMNEKSVKPEYHKIPDTKEEVQFMKESNREISKKGFSFSFPSNMYDKIFRSK
jgi:hypothetical protein